MSRGSEKRLVAVAPTGDLGGTEVARAFGLEPGSVFYITRGLARQLGTNIFCENLVDEAVRAFFM